MNDILDKTSAEVESYQPVIPSRPRRPKAKARKRWILFMGLPLITGAVVGLHERKENSISVSTERARTRNIVHLVSATGKIRPEREVKLSPEVAGEIIELPVVLGQRVKAGDLLAKIKPDNYIALVRESEASLSAAKALSAVRKAQMVNDDLDLRRSDELFSKRLISESEHTAAQTRAQVSRASYEASSAQIEVAQSNLDQNKDLLSKCTIFSPIDGTIDSLSSEVGERVVATGSFEGTEIMRIADLGSMEANVEVNENDVVDVHVGDKVEIQVDAYRQHIFTGTVKRIANTASVKNRGTQEEVTNFEVRIRIQHPELQIRPGMSTSVRIETETARQVVSVPIQSVTVRDGDIGTTSDQVKDEQPMDQVSTTNAKERERNGLQRVVFVKRGGMVKTAFVEPGIADDNYIQIISGIKAGDEVVSGPYTAISRDLKDGSSVSVE
jgi:HlyD family secretion protein